MTWTMWHRRRSAALSLLLTLLFGVAGEAMAGVVCPRHGAAHAEKSAGGDHARHGHGHTHGEGAAAADAANPERAPAFAGCECRDCCHPPPAGILPHDGLETRPVALDADGSRVPDAAPRRFRPAHLLPYPNGPPA